MTAAEARKITEETLSIKIDTSFIWNLIEGEARSGGARVDLPVVDLVNKLPSQARSNSERFIEKCIKDLEVKDYSVKRTKGYDQRDGDSWDYLTITW